MTRPRKQLVSVADTPYYHVVSRCVRRAYLCGTDNTNGNNYEHRRQWIVDRIRILSSLFSIDVCAYAIMSNHYHIVLKLSPITDTEHWSPAEVIKRWTSLFKGPILIQKWKSGAPLTPAELATVNECIEIYRKRLASLSWFMKCLNEPIAREANKEDKCTGHFWESRFKSQALLTEKSLLSCMAYVDLNPIRAQMANTLEESDHTSIQERLSPHFNLQDAIHKQINQGTLNCFDIAVKPLLHFDDNVKNEIQKGILFKLEDYLELVDYTGRIILPDKRGAIPLHLPAILKRLEFNQKEWIENASHFEKHFYLKFGTRRQHLRNTS